MKAIIYSFILGIYLFVSLITTASVFAQAPTTNANISNPAPGYFIDLTGQGKTNTFGDLILLIVEAMLGIVGILSVAFLIIGGFQYVASRGNEEQSESAKKTIANAIIGLTIVILSYVIIAVIGNALLGRTSGGTFP
ncbi:MAG: hypothetical protein HYW51_00125 [Candidatus Doudnabacteria bacterium]|nr:hypothetical protein [Candidatus Doudnabacteria bacterium]